jgi:hypothetical protein
LSFEAPNLRGDHLLVGPGLRQWLAGGEGVAEALDLGERSSLGYQTSTVLKTTAVTFENRRSCRVEDVRGRPRAIVGATVMVGFASFG